MKLAEDRFCSGCTACFAVCPAQAISMQWDRDGFTHPVVDEGKCTGCGLCNRVCPASNQSDPVMPLKCSASRTKDKALLEQSTSGGVFGELARWTLRNGGVVFGCIMGGDRLVAHHAKAETEVEVAAMRGAKYVQSEVGDTFRECLDALKSGRRVLFTGTPCQIAGLNRYLGHDYDNLLTMEIICHGVSSPAVLGKYLADVKRRQGETPRRIFFRSKADGYSWRHPGLVFEFPNCTKCEPLHGNAYFNAFAYGLATRLSCANCTAKSGASGADLTVGDFWGIGQVPETVKNDDMGMSVVIVYSAKAERLLDEIGSRLETYPLTLEQAVEGNPNYNRPSPSHPKRDIFMSSYKYADMSSLVNRFLGKRGFVPFCRKVSRVLKRICCLGFKTPSAGLRMAACATSGGGGIMKVGIITYHNPLNYGAQLQAYGLQETLRGLGHDPQIINYRGERYESVRICDFLRVRKPSYHVSLWNEAVKAKAFERNPMPFSLTSRTYETFSELYETPPGCEAYICGSDQIWQPKNNVDGRVVRCEFFLDFAEDGAKRIAYAPSFGQPLTDEYVSAIAPYVRKLDSISIREPDELERLKEATGRKDIDCVCDPTILLGADGFRSLCSERRSKYRRGLFCYMLSTDAAKDIAVIKAVSRRYGSATIVSRPFRLMFCGRNVGLGPIEWLAAIDNADFVATNSFHGTAFSLLFHKPFICLSWANKARNIRMQRLLDCVGLSDRMIYYENASAADEIASCEIDWSMVDEKLAAMRSHSMGYLQSALGVSG